MTDEAATVCPKCGEALHLHLVAQLKNENRFALELKPGDGRFSTETVGGVISQVGKFSEGMGKDMGIKTRTLVERITTKDDGSLLIEMMTVLVKSNHPEIPDSSTEGEARD